MHVKLDRRQKILAVGAGALVLLLVLRGRSGGSSSTATPAPDASSQDQLAGQYTGALPSFADSGLAGNGSLGAGYSSSDPFADAGAPSWYTDAPPWWETGPTSTTTDDNATTSDAPRSFWSTPLPGTLDKRMINGYAVYRDAGGWYLTEGTPGGDVRKAFLDPSQPIDFGGTTYRVTSTGDLAPAASTAKASTAPEHRPSSDAPPIVRNNDVQPAPAPERVSAVLTNVANYHGAVID